MSTIVLHSISAELLQVRGEESLVLLSPRVGGRQLTLSFTSLGGSVGTNGVPIVATAVVVSDWAELIARRSEVPGRIVVYAVEWEGYTKTQAYRSLGATIAAKFGAVASLMRSAGPFSINSPHTGSMSYIQDRVAAIPPTMPELYEPLSRLLERDPSALSLVGVPKIPHAALSVEDAMMLKRMHRRFLLDPVGRADQNIELQLMMEAENFEEVESRNTVAEIRGSELPDEIVLISGHIDSW
jgi:carboxypeptidase Q